MTNPRLTWPEAQWATIRADGDSDTAELMIYDRIGEGFFTDGVTAKNVAKTLAGIRQPRIKVRINSPGGSVFDGLTIYNALRDHPARVTVHIDGVAASIAGVIACAGDEVLMADTALFMVHNPYTYADGDAAEMRRTADLLDKVRGAMITAYETRTTLTRAQLEAALDAETWYDAGEAQAAGFADTVEAGAAAAAAIPHQAWFAHQPPTPVRSTHVDVDQIPGQTTIEDAAPDAAPVTTRDPLLTALEGRVTDLMARVSRMAPAAGAAAVSPLARFASLGEFTLAAYRDPAVMAAWTDQTTTDNPGLMEPTWLTDVKGIVDNGRPWIQGLGGPASAGDSGLEINYPYYDGDMAALFAKQTAEKTVVNSAKVVIKKGSAGLDTYAFGSDLSMQLIERSAPSYLDAYMRIMYAGYALSSDIASVAASEALATGTGTYSVANPGSVHTAVVDAAVKVWRATGAAPSIIGIAEAQWAAIAGAVDPDGRPLFPPVGASNASGTPTATGALAITIAGIRAVPVLGLAAAHLLVGNGLATRWHEDGPKQITNDVASKLGRDVSVYAYANQAVYTPAGVVKIAPAAATAK